MFHFIIFFILIFYLAKLIYNYNALRICATLHYNPFDYSDYNDYQERTIYSL